MFLISLIFCHIYPWNGQETEFQGVKGVTIIGSTPAGKLLANSPCPGSGEVFPWCPTTFAGSSERYQGQSEGLCSFIDCFQYPQRKQSKYRCHHFQLKAARDINFHLNISDTVSQKVSFFIYGFTKSILWDVCVMSCGQINNERTWNEVPDTNLCTRQALPVWELRNEE